MLLTKILVSLQLLHYYGGSAHPISPSNLLVKRAECLGELAFQNGNKGKVATKTVTGMSTPLCGLSTDQDVLAYILDFGG
jgi:hypothetical protein